MTTTGRDHDVDDDLDEAAVLGAPLELPCGVVLANRLVKAAMSDSLGDGRGRPTDAQVHLYERWLDGGAALAIVGEVQVDPGFAEKPGNLTLGVDGSEERLRPLADVAVGRPGHVWPQLGHAGALAHGPISTPAGPSALDLEGLTCGELPASYVEALPAAYAEAARRAHSAGFGGVQVHAGHGFLLSQFLSPLFNRRRDRHGGSILARSNLLIEVVRAIRSETGPRFPIAVKINSSDQLEGGLTEDDALVCVERLGDASVDVVDISGGTYFPRAASSSDRVPSGPYFVEFARRARSVTDAALMLTGGVGTRRQAAGIVASGAADLVGLARTMVIDPRLAANWLGSEPTDPRLPRFDSPPPGGITAWYTMRLAALGAGREASYDPTLAQAVDEYETRDARRSVTWNDEFA